MIFNLTLYLLRHGQTAHSRDNLFCGSGTEAELTVEGAAMGRAFAAAYKTQPFAAIFVSPMKRARETIRPLCEATGIQADVCEGLREIGYGKWEGKTVEEVSRAYGEDYKRWLVDPENFAPNDGETAREIEKRGMAVIDEIRQRCPSGNALLVAHKATIRVLISAMLGLPLKYFRYRLACPVCSLSTIEFTKDGALLQTLGDRSHLPPELLRLAGT